jgi:hypothetical protein
MAPPDQAHPALVWCSGGCECAHDELWNAGNRRREVALHREWMIRAFSIGLAVATIQPIVGFFFATARFTGLTPYEFFGTAFWIGFVLHLIAAEVWIQWTRPHAFKISSLYLRKENYHGDA